MKLVVDANVVISALIANSKTRELIVTLEPELLTPKFVHDEIGNYEDLIVKKSGMSSDRVQQFIDLLTQKSKNRKSVQSRMVDIISLNKVEQRNKR